MAQIGTRLFVVIAFLSFLTLALRLTAQTMPDTPITKENLSSALEYGKTHKDKRKLASWWIESIKKHHVDFQPTPNDEQEIRHAGDYLSQKGLDDLLAAVRDNYRPPIPATQGVLIPAEDPDPANDPCRDTFVKRPPNAVTIFYGSSAAWITAGTHVVLQVGEEDLLAINKGANGISVSAKIFGPDARIVARLLKTSST